ncbi:MAG: GTP-binding protein [Promethearchaeota archaeon]
MKKLPKLDLLKELLKNYMFEVDGAIAVAICDRDGFIIASESKQKNDQESDSVIGAISAFLDIYIDRIKNEYKTNSNFFNITVMEDKKFAYCSMGTHSILTTIASPATPDIELRVYSEHIAKKIELILDGHENISTKIPEIVRVLSKTRAGKLPAGKFSAKLIITGDYGVGKTSLIKRFVENTFQKEYISTIGIEISKKTISMSENTELNFIIWDIGGQSLKMTPHRHKFYEGASAAFIVIDRTRSNPIKSVEQWYNDMIKFVSPNIPIVIIGNKSDLSDEVVVNEEELRDVAKNFNSHYILTSAKTGMNVDEAFLYIGYRFIEKV